jgi:ATP-dependent phosphofructokinase / diphosphate-dependent phosphofructokinase
MTEKKINSIGILTSGGDCPGLNAAIRAVAKSVMSQGVQVFGILDGFRGLVENRMIPLEDKDVSGILTLGGTILGTSRDKPRKMKMGDTILDMSAQAAMNLEKAHIDALVCLGGNGTQKNAFYLHEQCGVQVVTLPKTIDNDVAGTDISFGFDTALEIATEAIDRLHTTATSHHRVIVCEIMGHKAGWLALGAGISGGADVILIPEIPYDLDKVVEHIKNRRRNHKRFSIIAVAEGAISVQEAERLAVNGKKKKVTPKENILEDGTVFISESTAAYIARNIEQLSGIETRVTSLGHVQRGGAPSAADRLLTTRLGAKAGAMLLNGQFNHMAAVRGEDCIAVPLIEVAGITRTVPMDHAWLHCARSLETCLGN